MVHSNNDKNYDDVYCYENGTLKNKFGITDRTECETMANRYANVRRKQLFNLKNKGLCIEESGWNADMLKDIHRALLGDVYEWAGEFRTVDQQPTGQDPGYEKRKHLMPLLISLSLQIR